MKRLDARRPTALRALVAVLVGLVLLGQVPSVLAVLGIGFVVAAGIGAERSGARGEPLVATLPECPPVTTSA